ncbi:gamma-glutamyltranspeptidase [Colletotrichum plurivorum]|uniref:Glutathione hydrolase n=1 Tax=Colletotrichum plurivorum TaxID=2175906 RepID=A0A8H6KB21_9PEZI|nr:gamma-glutamyltranspeptidase [Colletotrichum plurivorum]
MKSFTTTAALARLLLLAPSVLAAPSQLDVPKLGAVASETDVCSQVGIDILKKGGNAADSMVATVFCVGTIGMYHSGIAGGGFMLVRSSNGTYEFIDFRETAPAAAFQDMYNNNTAASMYGGLASGVPGELRGMEYLHKKYGRLPWADLVMPSVKIARDGFRVNEDLVRYMNSVTPNGDFLTNNADWAIDFAPNGYRVKLNETMTRKRYADTLEAIATKGADVFYTGDIAQATINALQKANGTMTLEDLKNYTVAIRDSVSINYRGRKITSTNAPSGGVVALSALNTVSGYEGFGNPAERNMTVHRLDEAMRFAYGQRSKLGDPLFVPGLEAYTKSMVAPATGAEIRTKISDFRTQNVSAYNPEGLESLETPGTSHVATADASGLAISLTTTINLLFGSQLIVPETGVIMNNEMNDFSIPGSSNAFGYIPSEANYIRPGKRPLSSISPAIVENPDGSLYYVIGAAGGSRIITSTIQNIHNVLDRNLTVPQALAEPRIHDQLIPNVISVEYAYDNGTTSFLQSLGHNVTWVAPGSSSAQGLRLLPNGTFEAAGEPRQKNSGGYAV